MKKNRIKNVLHDIFKRTCLTCRPHNQHSDETDAQSTILSVISYH